MNRHIAKAPGRVVVKKNCRGVIKLSWPANETTDSCTYLLQYRCVNSEGERWNSILNYPHKTISINYLQPDKIYVFRVATVTLRGQSSFGPDSEQIKIDPVCPPPSGLQCQDATDTSLTISWKHQNYASQEIIPVSSYIIDCWVDGKEETTSISRTTTDNKFTLEPLIPRTLFCIQVKAVCRDSTGSDLYSRACPVLKYKTLETERTVNIVQRICEKCVISPNIDTYKLPLKKQNNETETPEIGRYVFGKPNYSTLLGRRRQRTVLMVGASGSGKTTLINAITNYALGIEWEDKFRFKLIDEPAGRSQAHSQTDVITTYDLYRAKGSRLEYSLTVVDTPGFGDTKGVEKDNKIREQIRNYFKSPHGIRQLEAVCFVIPASEPRLTSTQKYIFDSILSIFGNDIKDNVRIMVTFSDGAEPPVLAAIEEANIPSSTYHKLNSSIFFANNKCDEQTNDINKCYFDMAVESFDRFFDDLSRMETKSLAMTREVLEERKKLEALVEGLHMMTQEKLTRVNELEKIKKILTENQQQMEANKDFEFNVLVPKSVDISGTGQFTTNCQNCLKTCHFPCSQSEDENKKKCSIMDPDGKCRICNCLWNVHFNQKYRYEMSMEKVMRSSTSIRQQLAAEEALSKEQMRDKIEKDIEELEQQCVELMQASYLHMQRLDEIALRPHSSSALDYLDLVIANEKQENRPGCEQRIATLQKLRKKDELRAELATNRRMVQSEAQPSTPSTQTLPASAATHMRRRSCVFLRFFRRYYT